MRSRTPRYRPFCRRGLGARSEVAMIDWDQLAADTGFELFFYTQPLVNGALEAATAVRVMEARERDGWELVLVGHGADALQLCFRRPYPDRMARLAQLDQVRALLDERQQHRGQGA